MRLLKWELKKIWQPGIVAAIVLLGMLYYFLFPGYQIENFRDNSKAQAQFDVAAGWLGKYGTTIEEAEIPLLEAELAAEKEIFAGRLKNLPGMAEAGITDYESFLAARDAYYQTAYGENGKADMGMEELFWTCVNNSNYYAIGVIGDCLELYEHESRIDFSSEELSFERTSAEYGYPRSLYERMKELGTGGSRYMGILPNSVTGFTREYSRNLAVWSVLSVILLLSPTLVRDRLRRTQALQWSSRRGRGVPAVQYAAAGLSALAVTLLNFIVYGIPFCSRGTLVFWNCGLRSLLGSGNPWFDLSYGQYLLVLGAMQIALALAAAGYAVFLSRYSGSFVAVLLKDIPLFVVLGVSLGRWLLDYPFMIRLWRSDFASGWVPKGLEGFLLAGLLLAAVLLCGLTLAEQRRRDLLQP